MRLASRLASLVVVDRRRYRARRISPMIALAVVAIVVVVVVVVVILVVVVVVVAVVTTDGRFVDVRLVVELAAAAGLRRLVAVNQFAAAAAGKAGATRRLGARRSAQLQRHAVAPIRGVRALALPVRRQREQAACVRRRQRRIQRTAVRV